MQDIKKYLIYVVIALLAYLAGDQKLIQEIFLKLNLELPHQSFVEEIYFLGKYKVSNVVDGDTVNVVSVSGEKDIVRIMAVDTLEKNETDPNKLCFAKKQTEFTKANLLNRDVYLYVDRTQGKRDRYNRILAYVATSTTNYTDSINNYFYNDYLLETGNADTYMANPPAILFARFESKKNAASEENLGMWRGDCK